MRFKVEKYNGKKYLTQAVNNEILGKLSLNYRYLFLNNNYINGTKNRIFKG